jgi:hypothetical protein
MPDYPSNFVNSSNTGNTSTLPFITHFDVRNPTQYDFQYPLQTRWVNDSVFGPFEWILVGFTSTGGVVLANWIELGIVAADLQFLTGNTGGMVPADTSHNINVIGDGTTVLVAGNPATNTLTISALAGNTTYDANTGSAIAIGGILNVLGIGGTSTAASGNTITITTSGIVPTQFNEDVGIATPIGGVLNVKGGTNINTVGSGNTITINAPTPATVATTYTENTGTATPAANNLNVLGINGITTSGAGSTITISGPASGLIQQVRTKFTTPLLITNLMPGFTNTAPTTSNGQLIMSVTITPTSASSVLVVETDIQSEIETAGVAQFAFFTSASTTAFAAMNDGTFGGGNPSYITSFNMKAYIIAGTTSPLTVSVYGGPTSGSSPGAEINMSSGSAINGTASFSSLYVTEFAS